MSRSLLFCYLHCCKARHTKNTYDLFSLHLDAKNRRVGGEKQSLAFLVLKRNSHNFKSLFMWFSTFLLLKDFYHKVSSSFFRIFLYCYLLHILAHCSTFFKILKLPYKIRFFGVFGAKIQIMLQHFKYFEIFLARKFK